MLISNKVLIWGVSNVWGSVGDAIGGETSVGVVLEGVAPAWNLLDQSLSFFLTEKKDGKAHVSPPPVVLSRDAQHWSNALIGNFLGKSLTLNIFQRTWNRLWGREGAVEIRFLAPSVYIVNFPSQSFGMCRWNCSPSKLEFAKLCIEVGAKDDTPSLVVIDLEEGRVVDVSVQLILSPKCEHCEIVGHSSSKCSKAKEVVVSPEVLVPNELGHALDMVPDGMGGVLFSTNNVSRDVGSSTVPGGFESAVLVVPRVIECAGPVDGTTEMSASGEVLWGTEFASSVSDGGFSDVVEHSVISSNCFDALEAMEGQNVDLKHGRAVVDGVVELMNQLKPKARGGGGKKQKRGFLDVVVASWNLLTEGNHLKLLFSKLKRLKEPLRQFNREHFSDVLNRVLVKRVELSNLQQLLMNNPSADVDAREK
ncbi:hypothetical protein V6N13_129141 [Hibiscus sabdariffa]